jgi:hypothetical protein
MLRFSSLLLWCLTFALASAVVPHYDDVRNPNLPPAVFGQQHKNAVETLLEHGATCRLRWNDLLFSRTLDRGMITSGLSRIPSAQSSWEPSWDDIYMSNMCHAYEMASQIRLPPTHGFDSDMKIVLALGMHRSDLLKLRDWLRIGHTFSRQLDPTSQWAEEHRKWVHYWLARHDAARLQGNMLDAYVSCRAAQSFADAELVIECHTRMTNKSIPKQSERKREGEKEKRGREEVIALAHWS